MNKVMLMGRITKDPELRSTTTGIKVLSFSIAVDRRFSGKGEQRQADFISCVAWRQTAEFIAKYFPKGRLIAVCGSLQTRTWDDPEGKKHYATEVVVEEAYFTGAPSGNNPSQNTAPAQSGYGGGYAPTAPSASKPVQDFGDVEGFAPYEDGSEDDLPF